MARFKSRFKLRFRARSQFISALGRLTIILTIALVAPLSLAPMSFAQGDLDRPTSSRDAAPASGLGGPLVDGVEGAARPAGSGDMTFLYITFAILGGLILFSILSSRKERKRREALLAAIRKHDRVQTIGGIIGSVVEVKPETVVVKVDEASNTRLTFARSAIQQVLKESSEPRKAEKEEKAEEAA